MSDDRKVKSVIEMIAEQPIVDRSETFDALWGIFSELRTKVDGRFELQMDDSTKDLQSYNALPGVDASGKLSAYSGDEIDWFVHSWIGNAKNTFANMHLTLWLPPTTRAPHLAFALATLPDIFFYMDFVPRVDLTTDPAYLDKYYEPMNARSIELRENPNMKWFFSKSLYVRQSLSETAFCYTCENTPENLAIIQTLAHEMMDTWFKYLDEAEPVPVEERAALAERDLFIRRTIAERDPANVLAERMFGVPLTERLVRALWGADRVLPRPGI